MKMRNNKIYILPTTFGFYFLLILLILFLIGLLFGNPLAISAAFIFFSIIFVSAIVTNDNLKHLNANISSGNIILVENEYGSIEVHTGNNSSVPRQDIKIKIAKNIPSSESTIDSKDIKVLDSPILEKHYGIRHIGRITLTTEYPFGIFKSWKYQKADCEIIIIPNPKGNLPTPILSKDVIKSDKENILTASSGDTYHQHTEYADGDNFKNIDWKIYAKTDELYIKEKKEQATRYALLDFDSIESGSFKDKISQLTKWIIDCHNNNIPFSLKIKSMKIDQSLGNQHFYRCLKSISQTNSGDLN